MQKTNFQLVAAMNEAFGNPRGDWTQPTNIGRITNQTWNIFDEFCEALVALGYDKSVIRAMNTDFKEASKGALLENQANNFSLVKLRDALCDINVFSYGAHHLMGYNADEDMRAVLNGVMTRFIKDEADEKATIAKHAAAGVTVVYFEGEYPTKIMKSAAQQPDAPVGKFLKAASFSEPVFPICPTFDFPVEMEEDSDAMAQAFAESTETFEGATEEQKQIMADSVMTEWSYVQKCFKDGQLQSEYQAFKAGLRFAGMLK